ncbi:MAG TPA: hypothetical protein VGL03_11265 [Thermoanaerobaculia bacterium]|jgi:hypothetical protein
MSGPARFWLTCVFFAATFLLGTTLFAEKIRNHFDADTMGRPPGFFDLVVLGVPSPARWLILSDPNPPSAPNRLAQVEKNRPADSIAAAIRRNYAFADGTVSAFIRQGPGRAGLLLRVAAEKDFLALLVDTASGDAVLSSYRGGKPTELGRGHATLARNWEKLSVTASGPRVSVFLDDQKLFDATDPMPLSGRTGLATAGPGEASFDEFVLEFEPGDGKR